MYILNTYILKFNYHRIGSFLVYQEQTAEIVNEGTDNIIFGHSCIKFHTGFLNDFLFLVVRIAFNGWGLPIALK